MSQSRRNPANQTKHDRRVAIEARAYEASGYLVEADIPGYLCPGMVFGHRPDVKAEKGGLISIVEVETPDSLNSAHSLSQHAAFLRARRRLGWRYRRVVTR